MKIYVKVIDADDFELAEVAMIAANSVEEAQFLSCGAHSKEEFVAKEVEAKNPKNRREEYKTEAGWKQAMDQFEAFNRKKYAELAEHQYYNVVGEINDTGVEIAVEKPCILWERKTY